MFVPKSIFNRLIMVTLAGALAACSSAPGPIVDTQGIDMNGYYQDLAACERYADQVRMETGVAKGAAAGGAIGAVTGAILGESVLEYGGVGAVAGGAKSAIDADQEKSEVVKRCMLGRGYKVLN